MRHGDSVNKVIPLSKDYIFQLNHNINLNLNSGNEIVSFMVYEFNAAMIYRSIGKCLVKLEKHLILTTIMISHQVVLSLDTKFIFST